MSIEVERLSLAEKDANRVSRLQLAREVNKADEALRLLAVETANIVEAWRHAPKTEGSTAGAVKATERKPLDDQRLQELFSATIDGALTSGYQGVSPPPDGHWLTAWWERGRTVANEEARHRYSAATRWPVCKHDPFEGKCVHCGVRFASGREVMPDVAEGGWCTYCGCGNDTRGYAHLPTCRRPHAAHGIGTAADGGGE